MKSPREYRVLSMFAVEWVVSGLTRVTTRRQVLTAVIVLTATSTVLAVFQQAAKTRSLEYPQVHVRGPKAKNE